jgi:hypothetical protein
MAGRAAGMVHEGAVRAARGILDFGDREVAAANSLLGAPISRVTAALARAALARAALARAALLPDTAIVAAVLPPNDAVLAVAAAYSGNAR